MLRDILTKENWIKGCHAQNDAGIEVSPLSPYAVKFDLFGAIIHLYPDPVEQRAALKRVRANIKVTQKFVGRLYDFNDSCTWEMMDQVLTWCDI